MMALEEKFEIQLDEEGELIRAGRSPWTSLHARMPGHGLRSTLVMSRHRLHLQSRHAPARVGLEEACTGHRKCEQLHMHGRSHIHDMHECIEAVLRPL